jgi:pimeloyl-ACP methyl ester carboxylesterase
MRAFGRGILGKAIYDQLSQARGQQIRDNRMAARAQIMGAGFSPLSDEDVQGVRTPTLLLVGQDSPAFLRRLSDRLQELLPNSECIEIANASHLIHEDNPSRVNETILDFLNRQPRRI